MKKEHYDLKTIPGNGYLVLPLSMSKLATSLSPSNVYDFFRYFRAKITHHSMECVLLYTNDLYLNSNENSVLLRKRLLNQMLTHKYEFYTMLVDRCEYVPCLFHFFTWDSLILNAPNFHAARAKLLSCMKEDPLFYKVILQDLTEMEKEVTDVNIDFLFEEIIVTHYIMEKEVPFPHHIANTDAWRLICYPGNPLASMVYTWKKNMLGNRADLPKQHQIFAKSFYNMEIKKLIDYDLVTVSSDTSDKVVII